MSPETSNEAVSTRVTIMKLLTDRKGLHKSELCRQTGKGWGTIGHHVYVLVQAGRIITEVHGRQLWVFLPDIPKAERDWIVTTHVPDRLRLYEKLLGRGGATIERLSSEMAVSKKTIRTHMSHLRRVGAVSRTANSPATYEVSPARKHKRP